MSSYEDTGLYKLAKQMAVEIHKIILENGSILMQQLTNFSQLPVGRRFQFFAPFIKIRGAEGSPARFFALLDD